MSGKKDGKAKPQPKDKPFTRKDFMSIIDMAANPKQQLGK